MTIHQPLTRCFSAHLVASIGSQGSSAFSYLCQKKIWQKGNLIHSQQGLNTQPLNYIVHAHPFNQFMFHDNSYNFRITLSLITCKHNIKITHFKITYNWHTQDSNLIPLNITKYSQPIKLILFHIITNHIKCHKAPTTRIY